MKILLISSSYNSLCQRANVALKSFGHDTSIVLSLSEQDMLKAVDLYRPDLIVCPFLKQRIPEKIWANHVCIIIHPGIKGDRGASSLDWAITNQEKEWGVTALQAAEEMDAGAIWSTKNFKMREASKAGLYRIEVSNTAIDVLLEAVERFESNTFVPEELDYSKADVHGKLQPMMKQAQRVIDWTKDSTDLVMRKILAADSCPGVLDTIHYTDFYLFGVHREARLIGKPGEIIAQRTGAICRATVDGAVWISHLKKANSQDKFKLPAATQLRGLIDDVPEIPLNLLDMEEHDTYREIWYKEQNQVGYLHFNFHNGAMDTEQCCRLRAAYLAARNRPTKVIVLMGGNEFWSNGIHLNAIEAAPNPGHESWRNINAMNDLVLDIINTDTHLTISSVYGPAGAGGVILALAADKVFARSGIIMNPHYKLMGLYGSEYWTYLLPKRVGKKKALELTENTLPVGMKEAALIGLIDEMLPNDSNEYLTNLVAQAEIFATSTQYSNWLVGKEKQRAKDENLKPLAQYREEELIEMKKSFYTADSLYHAARRDFVLKVKPTHTPAYLAKHLQQKRKGFSFFKVFSKKESSSPKLKLLPSEA